MVSAVIPPSPSKWISSTALITKMQTESQIGKVPLEENRLISDVAYHLLSTGDHLGGISGEIHDIETIKLSNLEDISHAMRSAISPENKTHSSNQATLNKLNTEITQYTVKCSELQKTNKELQNTLIEASKKVTEKINSFPTQDTFEQYKKSGHMNTDKEFQELTNTQRQVAILRKNVSAFSAEVISSAKTYIRLYGSDFYNPETRQLITPQELRNTTLKIAEASQPLVGDRPGQERDLPSFK